MTKQERKSLSAKYPYIVMYDAMMGSFQYWTDEQLMIASNFNAPGDTYQISHDGVCQSIKDITNPNLIEYFNLGWLNPIKTMTRLEAYQAMQQGKKITHRYFNTNKEYYYLTDDGIIAEDGTKHTETFYNTAGGDWRKDGWLIYNEK